MSECNHCGHCCHVHVQLYSRRIIVPDLPCKYLKDNLCTIYDRRFEKPWCRDRQTAIGEGLFAADCPYVPENYVGPLEIDRDTPMYRVIIRNALIEEGKPECVADELWERYRRLDFFAPRPSK